MRIDIVTLFPDMCRAVLKESMLGRAETKGLIETHCHQIRDYTENRQKQTEGYPYGGGPGKVLYAQPVKDCIQHVLTEHEGAGLSKPHVIFMTPAGKPYTEEDAKRLAGFDSLTLVCGHYEGFDERVVEKMADEEISIGDFVLTGGELAALVVADSVLRLQPGVLKTEESYTDESFWDGLLEYPQYTRPENWEGMKVPEILLSGNHEKIREWRQEVSLKKTEERRPDLYKKYSEKEEQDGSGC